jgi:uncharacterized membrane protein
MTLGPWLVWVPLLGLFNLLVFIAFRGRWGRSVPLLFVASMVGILIGNEIGARTGLELVQVGDMHLVAASVASQVLMLAVTLLGALAPVRLED